ISGGHWSPESHGQVKAEMFLVVDLPLAILVGAAVRECRHHLCVCERKKRPLGKELSPGLLCELFQSGGVFSAELAVAFQVALQHTSLFLDLRTLGENLRNSLGQELVGHFNDVLVERLWKELLDKRCLRLVARVVGRDEPDTGIVHIIGNSEKGKTRLLVPAWERVSGKPGVSRTDAILYAGIPYPIA